MRGIVTGLRGGAGPGLGPGVSILFWSYLVWSLGYALYITVLTLYLETIGVSLPTIGVVLGGAAVGRMLLSIPAGMLVDRMAPGPIVLATMALPVAGVALLAASAEWWQALGAAVLVELSGLGVPALSAWLAALASGAERTRAYAWVYTVGPQVANLIGPAVAGLVAAGAGYRPVFVVAIVAFAAGTALLVPLVRAGRSGNGARDGEGVSGTPAGDAGSRPDPTTVPVAPVAPIGPVVPAIGLVATVRQPWVAAAVGLHVLVPLLPYAGVVLTSNLLVVSRGLDVAVYGALGSLASAVGLAVALVAGRVRWLRDPFIGIAACLAAGGLGLLLLVPEAVLAVLIVAFALRGAMSPVWSFLSAAIADVTPEGARGRAFGVAEAAAGVGDVGAPLAAGRLYALDPVLPSVVAALTTLPLAVATWLAARRRPAAQPET